MGVDALGRGGFAVSGVGPVACRAGGGASRPLTWFDRTGEAVGVAGEPDANDLRYPELSPDGRRVALSRAVQGNRDVWLLDLLRSGMRIAFASNRTGAYDLYRKPSNGSGAEEEVASVTRYNSAVHELVFLVEEAPEGGFTARALSAPVSTEADTLDALRAAIRDAVHCHFDAGEEPWLLRLHVVRDELIPL